MTLTTIYPLISAALLFFVALIWSTKGWQNIAIKLMFAAASFAGIIVVARQFAL